MFLSCFACEKEQDNDSVEPSYEEGQEGSFFESLLGSWRWNERYIEGLRGGDLFMVDSTGWGPEFIFSEDLRCYYSEYNWDSDSMISIDTGSYFISGDSLYIADIIPVRVDFNSPIRGELNFHKKELEFKYKLINKETGVVDIITRTFYRRKE